MSEWTPKVGDKVMVGEHGPYEVERDDNAPFGNVTIFDGAVTRSWRVPTDWLTPAPEPEPEETAAFGELVRDGGGRLWICNPFDGVISTWDAEGGPSRDWPDIPRPITVVLANPAEVEQLRDQVAALQDSRDALRAERDAYRKAKQENDERFQLEAAAQRRRADELQRRIDKVLHEVDRDGYATRAYLHQRLRRVS